MTSSEDNEFLRRAKRGLDNMERHLDSTTIGRLRTARVQAIDSLNKPPRARIILLGVARRSRIDGNASHRRRVDAGLRQQASSAAGRRHRGP